MIRDAYRFLIPILILGILCAVFDFLYIAVPLFLLAAFVVFFFRNPRREIPAGQKLIVSPADGKIVKIEDSGNGERCVSIFLSVFNVHVNRAPIAGNLKRLEYRRGKFLAAYEDRASHVNEQNIITLESEDIQVTFHQIAGLIARRVVCWKQPGDPIQRGELIGLIRFGSRVDVELPEKVKIKVHVGDRVRGGCSILGEYE
jgi:phosphatidylserine decarboxylase